MKILYVFRSLAVWGGIERVLVEKMNHLVSMYGYDVYMVTADQGNHPVPYQLDERVHLIDLNIRFHQQYQYPLPKRLWVARKLRKIYRFRLSNQISKIKPDVIVCTTTDDISSLVKLKGLIPLVVESHSICLRTIEFGKYWLQKKWYRFNYLRALSKVDVLVALTEGDAKEWRKYHPHVEVIPNIVHLNKGPISTWENKRVIWVGRFDYQKRPLEMVRIWEKIQPLFPNWQLDMYGEGEQRQELEDRVYSLGMNIVIHQPTEHIFDYYRESSILMSTSLFEPFGLVIPEAMSCGLPIVAYDCPYGPSDIITDGANGFLIKTGDTRCFAEKVGILIRDKNMRANFGANGTIYSKRYESNQIMPCWKQLFDHLVTN